MDLNTSLQRLIIYGTKQKILDDWLKYEGDLHTADQNGITPLHQAILSRSDVEIIQQLLEHGANVDAVTNEHKTPLMLAVGPHYVAANVAVLLQYGANANISDCYGNSPLMTATAHFVDMETIQQLIVHGADINNECLGEFLLHTAVCSGYAELVRELLKLGTNVNTVQSEGLTPLHSVFQIETNAEIVNILLEHGAMVNAIDLEGNVPLHYAAEYPSATIHVKDLVALGADVRITNFEGESPLHVAVMQVENLEMIRKLIEFGAQIDLPDNEGITPIDIAADFEDMLKHSARFSIEHGARFSIDAIKCNNMLFRYFSCETFAMQLIRYTLIFTCTEDHASLIDLSPFKGHYNYDKLARFLKDCIFEIDNMKMMKVKNGLSLHSFVLTKGMNIPLYPDNESTKIITEEKKLIAGYPIYSDMILPKVKHALKRMTLLSKLDKMCIYSRNCCDSTEDSREEVALNYESVSVLAKFLTNDDLLNLTSAS